MRRGGRSGRWRRRKGAKLRAVAEFALRRMATPEVGYDAEAMLHSAQAEVGLRLRVSPSEASDLTQTALYLARRLPRTFGALEDGAISLAKVRVLIEESLNLSVAQCAKLEAALAGQAGPRTLRGFRNRVRREVERLDADAVRKRRAAAVAERALYVKDEPDGMATLCLYLPAAQVRAIYATVNSRIPAHPSPGDDRLIGARRVDHLVEVLAAAFGVDLRAVETAVPAPTAEQIARLDRGADSYVPSPALKAAVRARDRHCRFPGCRRPAVHCDVDHTNPFNLALKTGGRTVYTNLGCLCRFHHRVKQLPGWHLTQDQHGTFHWTDPAGRVFITRPPPPDGGEEPPDFWAPEEEPPMRFPF